MMRLSSAFTEEVLQEQIEANVEKLKEPKVHFMWYMRWKLAEEVNQKQ